MDKDNRDNNDYLFSGYNADPNSDPRLKAIYDDYYGKDDEVFLGSEDEPTYVRELSQDDIDFLTQQGFSYNEEDGLFYDDEGYGYDGELLLYEFSTDAEFEYLIEQGFLYNEEDGLFYDGDGYGYEGDALLAILGYNDVCSYDYFGGTEGMKWVSSVGKEPPAHSISRPVDIKAQKGPRCSAYSSSCLLRYNGVESKPKKLYNEFAKLPDGSALPGSVGRHIGAKMCTKGTIEDLERIIDGDQPALVLCYYGTSHDWNSLHYILITGYDDDNLYIADSLHTPGELFYNRVVKKSAFERMWDTSDTLPIKLLYGNNIYYTLGR